MIGVSSIQCHHFEVNFRRNSNLETPNALTCRFCQRVSWKTLTRPEQIQYAWSACIMPIISIAFLKIEATVTLFHRLGGGHNRYSNIRLADAHFILGVLLCNICSCARNFTVLSPCEANDENGVCKRCSGNYSRKLFLAWFLQPLSSVESCPCCCSRVLHYS